MVNPLLYVGGGLLEGVGKGLIQDGVTKREEALKQLTVQAQSVHDDRLDQRNKLAQNEQTNRLIVGNGLIAQRAQDAETARQTRQETHDNAIADRQAGQIVGTKMDDDGNMVGITRTGDTVDLGFKGQTKPTTTPTDDAHNQNIDSARAELQAFVSGKLGVDQTPNELLATVGQKTIPGPIAGMSVPNPNYNSRIARLVPKAQLAKVGGDDGQDSFNDWIWTPREASAADLDKKASDEATSQAYSELSKVKWIGKPDPAAVQQRAQEILAARKGQPSSDQTANAGPTLTSTPGAFGSGEQPAAAASPPAMAATTPAGSGSKVDPFQASGQSDVDWFKQSAPAGAVISINGKLYTK